MKITHIPRGTKDVLAAEAAEIRFLESSIRSVFASFGYGEVMTPTLELETALEIAGESRFKRSFRLFDEKGDVLVLRPEMTTPIARLVATKMADRQPPFRLCYFANSFRPTVPQRGRQSEFFQAGLELIGIDSPGADAEVLAIICQALAACGLRDFSIVLGEASFFRALLDGMGIGDEEREAIFGALAGRDLVELEEVVGTLGVPGESRQAILDVTSLRGGSDVLAAAKEVVKSGETEEALKRLARTYYLLSRYGFAGRILFDLGMMRNFEYYTGIVFEVLSGELGFPLGGGGRYDGLLSKFGRPAAAVGFAVGLDRLHIAVTRQGWPAPAGKPSVALVGGLEARLDLALDLREKGIDVLGLAEKTSREEAFRLAAESGFGHVAIPEDEGFLLGETQSGETVLLDEGELIDRITA